MATPPDPQPAPNPFLTGPWRGLLAVALLAVVGLLGPDIAPSTYWPELDHYIPRYILLAASVGVGLAAVRSGQQWDRLLGLAVVLVGCGMVAYIVKESWRILSN